MTANFMAQSNLDAVALDHRVGQQLVGDLGRERPGLRRLGRREIELEVLALPHVRDAAVAERMQRVGDGPALRVEHRRLERDEDARAHAVYTFSRRQLASKDPIEDMVDVPELLVQVERPLDLGRRQHAA